MSIIFWLGMGLNVLSLLINTFVALAFGITSSAIMALLNAALILVMLWSAP